jgi:glycosyltransferase involved in cell wall biosynthesis
MTSFNIYVPSYNRAGATTTYKLLDYCTYVVRKSQEEDYRNAGIKNIWAIDDDKIDSALKVYTYVIENAKEDVIALCDDDIIDFVFRLETLEHTTDSERITSEIEGLAQLTEDLRVGYLTTDSACQPYYQNPFFMVCSTSGAFKIVNRKYYKVKVDWNIEYCNDIDAILQELMTSRIVLHPNYFFAYALIDTNAGGISTDRFRSKVLDSVTAMENKWGKYFRYNYEHNVPKVRVKR